MLTEQERAYQRDYYHKNREKLCKRAKEIANKNPQRRREIRKRYADKNKKKLAERRNEYRKTLRGFLAYKISHLRKPNRRARKLDVSIDIAYLLSLWEIQKGVCAISGFPMKYPGGSLFSVTVDRIDPNRGYTTDNVQLVCESINFAKNKYTNEEFLEFWNFRNKTK